MGIGQLADFTSQGIYRFPINLGIYSLYKKGYNMILNRFVGNYNRNYLKHHAGNRDADVKLTWSRGHTEPGSNGVSSAILYYIIWADISEIQMVK